MRGTTAYVLPMIGNGNVRSREQDRNPEDHQKGKQNERIPDTKRIQIAFSLGNGASQRATASLFHLSFGLGAKVSHNAHRGQSRADEKPPARNRSEQLERHLVC